LAKVLIPQLWVDPTFAGVFLSKTAQLPESNAHVAGSGPDIPIVFSKSSKNWENPKDVYSKNNRDSNSLFMVWF
jgi:hypothetical protein